MEKGNFIIVGAVSVQLESASHHEAWFPGQIRLVAPERNEYSSCDLHEKQQFLAHLPGCNHNQCSWKKLGGYKRVVFSKRPFCNSEAALLDKKFWLFTNKKYIFQMDTSEPVIPFFGLVKY